MDQTMGKTALGGWKGGFFSLEYQSRVLRSRGLYRAPNQAAAATAAPNPRRARERLERCIDLNLMVAEVRFPPMRLSLPAWRACIAVLES